MSSESGSDQSDHESGPTNKRRKIQPDKMFKNYWLEDSAFKSWLAPDLNSKFKARCKVCNVVVKSGKSELQKHAATKKHTEKIKTVQETRNIGTMLKNMKDVSHKENVKKAEIKLAAFFASNNVAFRIIDQLEPILKNIFPDSKICKDIKIKRTKCTQIINNVLCKYETEDLVGHLQKNFFSILVDESTDVGDFKSLAVLVQYNKNNNVECRLLQLIQLDARDLGATKLLETFKECFEKHQIPLKNIIGVASDGAAVMIGKNHSFFKLLQDQVPHVLLLRCICHSAALVASNACNNLPRTVEDVVRNIYSYVSGSSKRSAQLSEIQEYFQQKKHKMLKLATTRWLSRYECVLRILENWNALQSYFEIAVLEDNLKSAENILSVLKHFSTKAYHLQHPVPE